MNTTEFKYIDIEHQRMVCGYYLKKVSDVTKEAHENVDEMITILRGLETLTKDLEDRKTKVASQLEEIDKLRCKCKYQLVLLRKDGDDQTELNDRVDGEVTYAKDSIAFRLKGLGRLYDTDN